MADETRRRGAGATAPPVPEESNAALARTIVDRLVAEGLVPEERRKAVEHGLAEGTYTVGDWRGLAESTFDRERRGGAR